MTASAARPVRDQWGRAVHTLRVSVTDRCNMRCQYCMPESGVDFAPHEALLSAPEWQRLMRVLVALGLCNIKFTGGEPLLRPDLETLIAATADTPGVRSISLTTNGTDLARRAAALKQAGLQRVTVSFDALDPNTFRKVTRHGQHDRVWEGILAAEAAGLSPIKLNCVVMTDNDADLVPLAALTLDHAWDVRFIEYMPVSAPLGTTIRGGVTPTQLRQRLQASLGELVAVDTDAHAPARLFRFRHGRGHVGFISSVSDKFCRSCDRLRLGADGFLRLCMSHPDGLDLKAPLRAGASDEDLSGLIRAAVWTKSAGHDFDRGVPVRRSLMSAIGG